MTKATAGLCGCGHLPTDTTGGATGYATMADGKTLCYPCADTAEREAFATADMFTGYVKEDTRQFTTWTGGKLAAITSMYYGKTRYTPSGGSYSIRYIQATAPDGSRWSGSGSSGHDVVTLRRVAPSGLAWQVRGVQITQLDRLPNSYLGCPRWWVHLDNGDVLVTMSGASDSYGIGNAEYRGKVDLTLTRAGRLSHIRAAVTP